MDENYVATKVNYALYYIIYFSSFSVVIFCLEFAKHYFGFFLFFPSTVFWLLFFDSAEVNYFKD